MYQVEVILSDGTSLSKSFDTYELFSAFSYDNCVAWVETQNPGMGFHILSYTGHFTG